MSEDHSNDEDDPHDEDDSNEEDDPMGEDHSNDDEREQFAPLGSDYTPNRYESPWLQSANRFASELTENNNADLSSIHLDNRIISHLPPSITKWFPVQSAVIPQLLTDIQSPPFFPPRDIAVASPTGSGKTLCYVLPIVQSLLDRVVPQLKALVVVPVQSLVEQIAAEFQRYGPSLIIGELSANRDYEMENRQPIADVIVATPGRLMDHLMDGSLEMPDLRYLVIDEADRIVADTHVQWLRLVERSANVIGNCGLSIDSLEQCRHLQKIVLSATLLLDEDRLQCWHLFQPRLFRSHLLSEQKTLLLSLPDGLSQQKTLLLSLPDGLSHSQLIIDSHQKPLALFLAIDDHPEWRRILCFTSHKSGSARLVTLLNTLAKSEMAMEMSSNLFGHRRHKVLNRFRTGKIRVLICSDILSRGIDVEAIDCVINYDLPSNVSTFIHRAGRTARAGASGLVLSIGNETQLKTLLTLLAKGDLSRSVTVLSISAEQLNAYRERYTKALLLLKETVDQSSTKKKKKIRTRQNKSKKSR